MVIGIQKLRDRGGYNVLNANIDKYEQHQCNQLAGRSPIQRGSAGRISPLLLFTPLVLFAYLGFLLLCEIIFDVEGLPDLLWGFAFDHVGHRLAGDI